MNSPGMASPMRHSEVLRRAAALLRERLPPGWRLDGGAGPTAGPARTDTVVDLVAPDGIRVSLALESRRNLVTRDLPGLLEQLAAAGASRPGPSLPMVVSPYLAAPVRAWLDVHDVSYLDSTGNLRLVCREPAVYLRDRGADRDPWRGPGRPRGSLRGAPAARVARALADHRPPLAVTDLVRLAGASTGATYRVLEFLEQEALVVRGTRGVVQEVRWRELIERWSQDYSFQDDHTVGRFLEPRGWPALRAALPGLPERMPYAVTGSLAAALWAPHAPARLATVYVADVAVAAERLGLREVDSGANVLLAAPSSDAPLQGTSTAGGIVYVAPSQAAADLLSGPGRNPSEGEVLLDWMEAHESDWRH